MVLPSPPSKQSYCSSTTSAAQAAHSWNPAPSPLSHQRETPGRNHTLTNLLYKAFFLMQQHRSRCACTPSPTLLLLGNAIQPQSTSSGHPKTSAEGHNCIPLQPSFCHSQEPAQGRQEEQILQPDSVSCPAACHQAGTVSSCPAWFEGNTQALATQVALVPGKGSTTSAGEAAQADGTTGTRSSSDIRTSLPAEHTTSTCPTEPRWCPHKTGSPSL